MSVLYILLPLALLFSGLAVGIFVWAVRQGQFDDLETPGLRMLQEDQPRPSNADASPTNTTRPASTPEAPEAPEAIEP